MNGDLTILLDIDFSNYEILAPSQKHERLDLIIMDLIKGS